MYKKAFGIDKNFNLKHGRAPEFILSSHKPGIADTIRQTNKWEKIKKNQCVFITTKNGLITKKIPQFLKNKWKDKEDRNQYFKSNDERARELKAATRARLKKTDLSYWQYQKLITASAAEKYVPLLD